MSESSNNVIIVDFEQNIALVKQRSLNQVKCSISLDY